MVNIAVLGASGGIGQPLSMLLKLNPRVSRLALYTARTRGVAEDIGHIETLAPVSAHVGPHHLEEALQGADIVMVPAGLPRKPGMTRDDLFIKNATIIADLAAAAAKVCPRAMVAVITNPLNTTVPIFSEVYRRAGVLDTRRMFGVTTLDVVRTNEFYGTAEGLDPSTVSCPVVGGHAGTTILPLLSQCSRNLSSASSTTTPTTSTSSTSPTLAPPTPVVRYPDSQRAMTDRIQFAGTEVVNAKEGSGSATLSMSYAAARFADSLIRGMAGEEGVVECAYVASTVTSARYFASPLVLGPGGVEEHLGLGQLSPFEQEMLKEAIPKLVVDIEKGERFVAEEWAARA